MPQANAELQAKFPGDDREAWEVLDANFLDDRGVIRTKQKSYLPTPREMDAIAYLFHEWDYDYQP